MRGFYEKETSLRRKTPVFFYTRFTVLKDLTQDNSKLIDNTLQVSAYIINWTHFPFSLTCKYAAYFDVLTGKFTAVLQSTDHRIWEIFPDFSSK